MYIISLYWFFKEKLIGRKSFTSWSLKRKNNEQETNNHEHLTANHPNTLYSFTSHFRTNKSLSKLSHSILPSVTTSHSLVSEQAGAVILFFNRASTPAGVIVRVRATIYNQYCNNITNEAWKFPKHARDWTEAGAQFSSATSGESGASWGDKPAMRSCTQVIKTTTTSQKLGNYRQSQRKGGCGNKLNPR